MIEDGPHIITLNCAHPRATRDHECSFCHDPIIKGTKYTSYVGLEDGKFVYWKHHIVCPKHREITL